MLDGPTVFSPEQALALALAEARAIQGRTSPNPPVGAVVVRDGLVVGRGGTQPPGGPHAEQVALLDAGPQAHGADLYVTLEPCTFHGRTPPCTDAITAAGIRQVFYVARDADPRIGVGAAAVLRPHGITVQRLADPAGAVAELLAPFRCRIATGRPFVTAKYAMSLDGRIATATGESRWISGPESRQLVHHLRDRVDAILVGVGTVLADDPQLTTRLTGHWRPVRHPLRVIVDSTGRTPPSARILDPHLPGSTLIATVSAPPTWAEALTSRGAQVEYLPAGPDGRVALPNLLALLGARGINHLLVEGGTTLLGALAATHLIDEVWAFVAPIIIGAAAAPGPVGDPGITRLADAHHFITRRVERHGTDTLIVAVRPDWWPAAATEVDNHQKE